MLYRRNLLVEGAVRQKTVTVKKAEAPVPQMEKALATAESTIDNLNSYMEALTRELSRSAAIPEEYLNPMPPRPYVSAATATGLFLEQERTVYDQMRSEMEARVQQELYRATLDSYRAQMARYSEIVSDGQEALMDNTSHIHDSLAYGTLYGMRAIQPPASYLSLAGTDTVGTAAGSHEESNKGDRVLINGVPQVKVSPPKERSFINWRSLFGKKGGNNDEGK